MPNPDRRLRESLHAMLSGSAPPVSVREEIQASWARSAAQGLPLDGLALPSSREVDLESRLMYAAMPVIDDLAADLVGTETGMVVSDDQGIIVHRRVFSRSLGSRLDRVMLAPGFSFNEEDVGTNGIGTPLVGRKPIFVVGGEHFADAFVETACAGAPITDPHNGQLLGVIDFSTAADQAHSLMLPFVKRASWDIEQRLLDGTALIDRILYRHFLGARRRTKGPLVLVGERSILTNTAASRLVDTADRERLWEWALRTLTAVRSSRHEVVLANGSVMVAECDPVYDAGAIVGAVVRFRSGAAGSSRAQSAASHADRPLSGWESLTETERSVASLVAEGYTNREAAARLFLSWHTVDSHLRHIYTKLGITSRVQLARINAERRDMGLAG
jgi:sigma-54 dependent transcriptional regulator, acetoin dehydrogenase operon transcriptional activator AcoR